MKRSSILLACVLALSGLPAVALAEDGPREGGNVTIGPESRWTIAEGVVDGSGTATDPYVISGWKLRELYIHDTDAYFIVRDNVITGQLTLNWNGNRATVVDNQIGDLRVNENVRRTGGPTSGRIAHNRIGFVGQLRHFDGVFARNIVGTQGGMELPLFSNRAVNFDGFNGARFVNNTIYGYVDVKIHGHHHGSGFGDTSHDHSTAHDHTGHSEHGDHDMVDHTTRYHEVWISGNEIHSTNYYALGYNDRVHAANDRTANSEQNEALNKPHVHHTRVHLVDNALIGAGLEVDIFNSEDELHREYATGWLEIRDNRITLERDQSELFQSRRGISVRTARDAVIEIVGNSVTGTWQGNERPFIDPDNWDSGIETFNIKHADLHMARNRVENIAICLTASRFSNVDWHLRSLTCTNVETEMDTDDSAKPRR